MQTKKSKKANLENKRTIFFQLALIAVLTMILAAFEWSSEPSEINVNWKIVGGDRVDEAPPLTRRDKQEPITKPLAVNEKILIYENDVEIEDDEFAITEVDPDELIDIVLFEPEDEESVDDIIFVKAEIDPKFNGGGPNEFSRYLMNKIRFPEKTLENGVDGRMTVRFVVNIDGSITDIQIIRSFDKEIDKEVIRVLNECPKWEPGIQGGRKVRCHYVLPIAFQIN